MVEKYRRIKGILSSREIGHMGTDYYYTCHSGIKFFKEAYIKYKDVNYSKRNLSKIMKLIEDEFHIKISFLKDVENVKFEFNNEKYKVKLYIYEMFRSIIKHEKLELKILELKEKFTNMKFYDLYFIAFHEIRKDLIKDGWYPYHDPFSRNPHKYIRKGDLISKLNEGKRIQTVIIPSNKKPYSLSKLKNKPLEDQLKTYKSPIAGKLDDEFKNDIKLGKYRHSALFATSSALYCYTTTLGLLKIKSSKNPLKYIKQQ